MTTQNVTEFGRTASGALVHAITLENDIMRLRLLTLGAILQSLHMQGVAHDLTLGSTNLADYEGAMCYHGSVIAPVVNRITNGRAMVAGKLAEFDKNILGRHTLHSGAAGTQYKIWNLAECSAQSARLTLHLPDGEGGFAGNREIEAIFTLAGDTLRMDLRVISDSDTIWNAANHSYWNLNGSADFSGHSLRIAADHILPLTADFVPTGELQAVEGGAYDFRTLRGITPQNPPLDTNFCLGFGQTALREVLVLRANSGVTLRLYTTEAGVQVYDCRHSAYSGLALEAQNWPDAPNHAHFPSIMLRANQPHVQSTAWHFTKG
jgi:aldose 1-epimerase